MNLELFATINSFAGHFRWLDQLGVFLAVYLTYLIVMALIYGGFLAGWKYGKRMFWEAVSVAIISRILVVDIIRLFYKHPRPFMVEPVQQLISESGWSFPSGHTTFLFALSTAVWFYNRKLGYILFVGSFLVGIARIYVGVHWPFDILGGMVVGMLTAIIIHQLVKFYLNKSRILQ